MSRVAPARQTIRDVRHFNRFYTKQIGLLQDRMLSSPFSLTEVRILYEIAHRRKPTASDLIAELGLDAGYLSRSLTKLERQQLIRRERSASDPPNLCSNIFQLRAPAPAELAAEFETAELVVM